MMQFFLSNDFIFCRRKESCIFRILILRLLSWCFAPTTIKVWWFCRFFLFSFSRSNTVIYQLLSRWAYRFYVKNYPRKLYLFSFYSARLWKILPKKGGHLLYLKTILFKLKILKKFTKENRRRSYSIRRVHHLQGIINSIAVKM